MSRQREITTPTPLLAMDGTLLRPGWARRMLYLYNRHRVAGRPLALKEWDFYQFQLGEHVLQMTIGHVSYMAHFSATLFSTKTGVKQEFSHMRPLPGRGLDMPLSPDAPHYLAADGKDFAITFDVNRSQRHLSLQADGVDIDMRLPRRQGEEKLVIATPFDDPHQFYLNCKEHYYGASGHARFGNVWVRATPQDTALLDWGRGVWPFHQEWFWGCGAGYVPGGRFGFNLGWGFGNLRHATENVFFWNGKAHKLGALRVQRDEADYMAPWHFASLDGRFELTMTPTHDNFTQTKLAFVDNRCHQVFGLFSGRAVLPNGIAIAIDKLPAFCEHAVNNW